MLRQRVITAIVLLAVLGIALTVAAPWGFPLLAGLFIIAATWEWLRLVQLKSSHALLVALLVGVGLAAATGGSSGMAATGAGRGLLMVAALAWCLLAARLVVTHRFYPVKVHRLAYGLAGVVLVAACWIAVTVAYTRGILFLVSALALVWAADIGAYFSGRAFGRHKLAPAISPNKTWEGVAGGVVAVWALALVCAGVPALNGTFFAQTLQVWPWPLALLWFTVLAGISVVGDLFESHLKREAGVKDSSGLLPGHGGVLDRIDAVLPVLPLVILVEAWA